MATWTADHRRACLAREMMTWTEMRRMKFLTKVQPMWGDAETALLLRMLDAEQTRRGERR